MPEQVVSFSRRRGALECEVLAVTGWDGAEKLVKFLEKHYGGAVVEHADGPDARRWVVEVEGQRLEVQHEDPWGNTLVAPDAAAEPVLRKVAADLEARLKD